MSGHEATSREAHMTWGRMPVIPLAFALCSGCVSTDTARDSMSSRLTPEPASSVADGPDIGLSRSGSLSFWPESDLSDPYGLILQFPSSFSETQQASNWCWSACVTSVINGLVGTRVITQEQVVAELFGGTSPDRGATHEEIVRSIDGRKFEVPFEHGGRSLIYTIRVTHYVNGVPSWEFLRSIADGDHAIIAALYEHAVVVTGAANISFGSTPVMQHISVDDPWPRKGRRDILISEALDPGSKNRIDGIFVVKIFESMQ